MRSKQPVTVSMVWVKHSVIVGEEVPNKDPQRRVTQWYDFSVTAN